MYSIGSLCCCVGVQAKSAILTDFPTLDMHQEAHDSLIWLQQRWIKDETDLRRTYMPPPPLPRRTGSLTHTERYTGSELLCILFELAVIRNCLHTFLNTGELQSAWKKEGISSLLYVTHWAEIHLPVCLGYYFASITHTAAVLQVNGLQIPEDGLPPELTCN